MLERTEVLITKCLGSSEVRGARTVWTVSAVSNGGTRIHASVECLDEPTYSSIDDAMKAHRSTMRQDFAVVAVMLTHGNCAEVVVSSRTVEGPKASLAKLTLAGAVAGTAATAAPLSQLPPSHAHALSKKDRRAAKKALKKSSAEPKAKKDKKVAKASSKGTVDAAAAADDDEEASEV